MVKDIFKIQKPMFSSDEGRYLIYNRDRSVMSDNFIVGNTPALDELFDSVKQYNVYKIYVNAQIHEDNSFEILDIIIDEQTW